MANNTSIEDEGHANALLDRATARQALMDQVLHEPVWARTLRSLTAAVGIGGPITAVWLLSAEQGSLDAGMALSVVVVPILLLAIGLIRSERRVDALVALCRDSGLFDDVPAQRTR